MLVAARLVRKFASGQSDSQAYLLAIFAYILTRGSRDFAFGRPLTSLYTNNSGAITASLLVILFSLLGTPWQWEP